MGDSTADLFDEVGWDEVERNVEQIREWEASGLRLRLYPPANRDLATRVLQHGALVSQFWPDAPPTRVTFPMRNVVTSGIALGTVVVEASGKSGARLQARLCSDHGKRLFLLRSLVLQEEWAQRYAQRPGTTVVESVDEFLNPPVQLSLY
jgi:DNA processing protein